MWHVGRGRSGRAAVDDVMRARASWTQDGTAHADGLLLLGHKRVQTNTIPEHLPWNAPAIMKLVLLWLVELNAAGDPCLGNLHDTTAARWNSVPAFGLATPTHDHLEGLVCARVSDRRCLTPGCILHVFWLYYGGASLFVASSLASWRTTPESFPATPEVVRTCRRQASLCQMSSLQPKAMRLDQVKTRWQSIWMTCSAGAQRHCPAAAAAPAAFP